MQNLDTWRTFEETGSVMDYLKYKNVTIDASQRDSVQAGGKYGSEYSSDRNDTFGVMYGGI